MNPNDETRGQEREKRGALSRALPLPPYDIPAEYTTKEFTRRPKSGLLARPNHLGDRIEQDLPEGF